MPADPSPSPIVAEPGGRYARNPPLVVDCSVLTALLFDDDGCWVRKGRFTPEQGAVIRHALENRILQSPLAPAKRR